VPCSAARESQLLFCKCVAQGKTDDANNSTTISVFIVLSCCPTDQLPVAHQVYLQTLTSYLRCCNCCPAVNATKTAGSTAVNATTSVAKDVGGTVANATTAAAAAVTPKSGATSVTASAAIAGAAVLGSAMLLLL
jgi:hypothetical protein